MALSSDREEEEERCGGTCFVHNCPPAVAGAPRGWWLPTQLPRGCPSMLAAPEQLAGLAPSASGLDASPPVSQITPWAGGEELSQLRCSPKGEVGFGPMKCRWQGAAGPCARCRELPCRGCSRSQSTVLMLDGHVLVGGQGRGSLPGACSVRAETSRTDVEVQLLCKLSVPRVVCAQLYLYCLSCEPQHL